jgi:integrase
MGRQNGCVRLERNKDGKPKFWLGRWREDVIQSDGSIKRMQRSRKLAKYDDRFRCDSDVRPLLDDILRPLNEGKTSPESTLPIKRFVEDFYLPFIEENYKPSTYAGYNILWETYLASRLEHKILRDFRTVDAANLLAEIHRMHGLGRTTLKHVKSFLSGVFTWAKNRGVMDGVNPVQGTLIPKKAAGPKEAHATTTEEALAMLDTLEKAGHKKAQAAVALTFFAGLRPGEARGVRWEDYDGKTLTVRQSVWHTVTTEPKTENSSKPLPVIEPLRSILAELRAADGNPASGPILRGPSGKRVVPLNLDNLARRIVQPTLEKARLKAQDEATKARLQWHGWYALRRGVATALTAISKGSLAAKGLLRHTNVATTERHYIKDVPKETQDAMNLLEAVCSESGVRPS